MLTVLGERGFEATFETAEGPGDGLFLATLGRSSAVPGTQRWGGAWGWILPDVGDFVTLQGAAATLGPCLVQAGVTIVDTHRVLRPDGDVVTDTGGLRSPFRGPDAGIAALDIDALARVVTGIEACR